LTPISDRLAAWTRAELNGDVWALASMLHPEFLAVGPFGYLLDRPQWMQRYSSGALRYSEFTFTVDTDARMIGTSAFVVGTQRQRGTHDGHAADGAFRASLVFNEASEWLLASIHLSLRTPPGTPATT
jgi:ketosteroid isomerase-like protein